MARGGKRAGAGRPPGSGWLPAVAEMRAAAATQMVAIVGSDQDPLSFVIGVAFTESVDIQTRIGAASIALPYLYPKLSASTVDSRHTITKIDGAELVARLEERLSRLAPGVTVKSIDAEAEEAA